VNDLEKYFFANTGRVIHKWRHYFDVYDRHFSRFRSKPITLVEIGVFKGGSLQMWKHYFGPSAQIYGIDVNPECKKFEEDRISIFIGSQEDRGFLKSFAQSVPKIDILIDDGGHTMGQQIATFEELYPYIDENGVYLCEDLHTSYWPDFGGGYKKAGSFIEYSKNFIDYLNAWHIKSPSHQPWYSRQLPVIPPLSDFTRSANSLHYYDSMLVIEKRPSSEPTHIMTGKE
jgi:hypothetical protein